MSQTVCLVRINYWFVLLNTTILYFYHFVDSQTCRGGNSTERNRDLGAKIYEKSFSMSAMTIFFNIDIVNVQQHIVLC